MTEPGRGPGAGEGPDEAPADGRLRYRRILLKLSGEALLGERQYGVDRGSCAFIAHQIAEVHAKGVENVERVQSKLLDGIGPVFGDAAAVAPGIVSDDPERLCQRDCPAGAGDG